MTKRIDWIGLSDVILAVFVNLGWLQSERWRGSMTLTFTWFNILSFEQFQHTPFMIKPQLASRPWDVFWCNAHTHTHRMRLAFSFSPLQLIGCPACVAVRIYILHFFPVPCGVHQLFIWSEWLSNNLKGMAGQNGQMHFSKNKEQTTTRALCAHTLNCTPRSGKGTSLRRVG